MAGSPSTKKTQSRATSRPSSGGATSRGNSAKSPQKPTLEPPPDRDPGGQWERAVRQLARDAGTDPDHLVEEFDERAAILTYLGEMDLHVANATAFEHVKARLFPPAPQPLLFEEAA